LKKIRTFGQIESTKIIKDAYDGRSKKFEFAEKAAPAEDHSAMDGLNGKEPKGRTIKVNQLSPAPQIVEVEQDRVVGSDVSSNRQQEM
jgi:RNA recognition motif-containing protein